MGLGGDKMKCAAQTAKSDYAPYFDCGIYGFIIETSPGFALNLKSREINGLRTSIRLAHSLRNIVSLPEPTK
jgi:hypothetical protein